MRKTGKKAGMKVKGLTLGRGSFGKISAIEGIRLTRDMKGTFRSLDKQGASAAERRGTITKKYGRSS